jgi:hypothetical protein
MFVNGSEESSRNKSSVHNRAEEPSSYPDVLYRVMIVSPQIVAVHSYAQSLYISNKEIIIN